MTLSRTCIKEDDPRKFAEERRLILLLGENEKYSTKYIILARYNCCEDYLIILKEISVTESR